MKNVHIERIVRKSRKVDQTKMLTKVLTSTKNFHSEFRSDDVSSKRGSRYADYWLIEESARIQPWRLFSPLLVPCRARGASAIVRARGGEKHWPRREITCKMHTVCCDDEHAPNSMYHTHTRARAKNVVKTRLGIRDLQVTGNFYLCAQTIFYRLYKTKNTKVFKQKVTTGNETSKNTLRNFTCQSVIFFS